MKSRPLENRCAVIDIGTNTVNLLVCDIDPDTRGQDVVLDESVITRLGEGLPQTGQMQPEAIDRTWAAIRQYITKARRAGASRVVGVGTSVLRDARNTPDFLDLLRNGLGLNIEVIPSASEARLSYLSVRTDAALSQPETDLRIVTDVGSGSTEFVYGRFAPGQWGLDTRLSVRMGAVNLTERFLPNDPPHPDQVTKLDEWIRQTLLDHVSIPYGSGTVSLVGVGGTVVNLAAIQGGIEGSKAEAQHGRALSRADISRQIDLFCSRSSKARSRIAGLNPRRADIIIAGAAVLRATLDHLGTEELRISTRGLRYGVMYDRFVFPEEARDV